MSEIFPGDRVMVFDSRLYRDDVSTPPSMTMRSATVIRRYGRRDVGEFLDGEPYDWTYPDLVDVEFDHREGVSSAHFTSWVQRV